MPNINSQVGQWNRTNNTYGLALPLYNYVDNGDMSVNQRKPGTSIVLAPSTTGFCMDRWMAVAAAGTGNFTVNQALVINSPGQIISPDNPDVDAVMSVTLSAGTVGATSRVEQWIPNAKMMSGKNMMYSAWIQSSAAFLPKLEIVQYFGSGGSPSASVLTSLTFPSIAGLGWIPLTMPVTFGSLAGKTFGSDTLHGTIVRIYPSSGGGVAGSCLIDLVQLEEGNDYTGFHRKLQGNEFLNCLRYYQKSFVPSVLPVNNNTSGRVLRAYNNVSANFWDSVAFPIVMQKSPTMIFYNPSAGTAAMARNYNTANDSTATTNTPSRVGFEMNAVPGAGWAAGHLIGYQWEAKGDFNDPA